MYVSFPALALLLFLYVMINPMSYPLTQRSATLQ